MADRATFGHLIPARKMQLIVDGMEEADRPPIHIRLMMSLKMSKQGSILFVSIQIHDPKVFVLVLLIHQSSPKILTISNMTQMSPVIHAKTPANKRIMKMMTQAFRNASTICSLLAQQSSLKIERCHRIGALDLLVGRRRTNLSDARTTRVGVGLGIERYSELGDLGVDDALESVVQLHVRRVEVEDVLEVVDPTNRDHASPRSQLEDALAVSDVGQTDERQVRVLDGVSDQSCIVLRLRVVTSPVLRHHAPRLEQVRPGLGGDQQILNVGHPMDVDVQDVEWEISLAGLGKLFDIERRGATLRLDPPPQLAFVVLLASHVVPVEAGDGVDAIGAGVADLALDPFVVGADADEPTPCADGAGSEVEGEIADVGCGLGHCSSG